MKCASYRAAGAWILASAIVNAAAAGENHSPERSARAFEVRDGYRVELAAVEPVTVDPVAARFDPRGRLWVVEMPDYPTGPRDQGEPSGRIQILSDSDGDGRFDQATTFADGLAFATGVQPYGDGALVTLAGKIVHYRDSDGDGVADRRDVLFQGFATGNEQLRANHPTLGPDGLVYVAGGLRGGEITAVAPRYDASRGPIDLRDRDFCFDPEGGLWKAVAGKSQFGLSIDDFGRRVGCSNRNPAMTPPLALEAVARDPLLAPRDAVADVAAAAEKSRVVPIADAWTTSNLHAGQFSAACGVIAPGIRNKSGGEWLLVCEPTGSLVQRQRLVRTGSTWASQRERAESEFLASSDTWFRPVDLTVGPGGDVYVVDMARAVIEHPDWMPSELKNRPDLWHGDQLGRIWRVRLEGERDAERAIAAAEDALRWLGAENPWQREMASQYFLTHGIADQHAALRAVVRSTQASAPARARAALLLDRFDRLSDEDGRALLSAAEPRLRGLGVRLAADRGALLGDLLKMAGDSDLLVARELAQMLGAGGAEAGRRTDALARIAARGAGDDRWLRRSLASVEASIAPQLAKRLLAQRQLDVELGAHLIRRIAGRAPEEAAGVLAVRLGRDAKQQPLDALSARLLEAWQQGTRAAGRSVTAVVTEQLSPQTQAALQAAQRRAAATALSDRAGEATRATCIRLVAGAGAVPEDFRRLVAHDRPLVVRQAALEVLLAHDAEWMRAYLNDHLAEMTLRLRLSVVDACLRRGDNTRWLLGQIEEGSLPKTIIDPATAGRLRKHRDEAIRQAANKLFAASPDRLQVFQRYASAADSLGDSSRGEKLFVEHCSACHKIAGTGVNVGPDISDTRIKQPKELLRAILVPNAAIDADFLKHSVLTLDGRILDGLLVDETEDALTLAQQGGERVTIPWDEVDQMQTPGVSLMPEGFEQSMTVEQMSDLLAYLKNWRYLTSDIPIELAQ